MAMVLLLFSVAVGCVELSCGARNKFGQRSHHDVDRADVTRVDRDIQEFVISIFKDVIEPSAEKALSNACSKFGHRDAAGKLMWALGKPPEGGAEKWSCNEPMGGVKGVSERQWRQILIENYVYDQYHFIPVVKEDAVGWAQYKHDLLEALSPFREQILCDVQQHTRKMQRLKYFFEDADLMDEVQDYRWMRFYMRPQAYNRRLSINVPTVSRPAFTACAIEKLLITGKINQMKVHMIHAMETENTSVPLMTSDNIIMYLLKDDDLNSAVQQAQECLDGTVGPFDRPGPHCMKRMGDEGGVGANIYGAADDLTSGMSYGQRLASFFGKGYLRMVQRDDPGARDPGCLKQVVLAIGQLFGAYQPKKVNPNERVTVVRFAEGLAGALADAGLKRGLDGLGELQ